MLKPTYPLKETDQTKICESFRWMTEEFKTASPSANSIKIKGVALKADVVSRNKRHYVAEELEKAARSWIGKPITINHNPKEIVGNVEWMEYEDGLLEYLGVIKKQPYVDLLRNKSADIKGVSVEANYLRNQCPRCGERFESEDDFYDHMENIEFIKNFSHEPRGISGTALSLVLSPEEPGVLGTTWEIMESTRGDLRLLETVIKEREKMRYPIKEKKVKEQEEHNCAEDEEWSETEGKCVPKTKPEPVEEQEEAPNPPCPEGYHEVDGKCVKDVVAEQEEHSCSEGEHWDSEQNKCVPDTPPPKTEEIKLRELDLPKKLRLGEPFADYTDFDDCVSKNTGKVDDPEAFCAVIKRKVEGETVQPTKENTQIYEAYTDLNKRVENYHQQNTIRNVRLAEAVNKLNDTIKEFSKMVQNGFNMQSSNLTKQTSYYLPKQTFQKEVPKINKQVIELKQQIVANRQSQEKRYSDLKESIPQDDITWKTEIAKQKEDSEKVITQLQEDSKQLKETTSTQQQGIESMKTQLTDHIKADEELFAKADKVALEKDDKIKTMQERLQELEKENKAKDEKIKETASTDAKLEKLTTKVENLEEKLTGKFKGGNKPVVKKDDALPNELPYKS